MDFDTLFPKQQQPELFSEQIKLIKNAVANKLHTNANLSERELELLKYMFGKTTKP